VVAVFVVDMALEHVCAEFRLRATDGQITAVERDLLTDGAILLAAKIENLVQDSRTGSRSVRTESRPGMTATPVADRRRLRPASRGRAA
jgi:hypothetical protein